MYTVAVPDNFPDLYKLPTETISRIREEFPVNGIWMEGETNTSIFMYDNNAFILYRYVTSASQPTKVRIHAKGKCSGLEMPLMNGFMGKKTFIIPPLYQNDKETVFELSVKPGDYQVYKVTV